MPAMMEAAAMAPESRAFMSVAFPDEPDDEQQECEERHHQPQGGEVALEEDDAVQHEDHVAHREAGEAEGAPRQQRRARLAPRAEEQQRGGERGERAKRIDEPRHHESFLMRKASANCCARRAVREWMRSVTPMRSRA